MNFSVHRQDIVFERHYFVQIAIGKVEDREWAKILYTVGLYIIFK